MPDKSFRVRFYVVESTREDEALAPTPFTRAVIDALEEPFENRMLRSSSTEKGYRLDHYEEREGCYLLNFTSHTFDGPGRATPTQVASAFNLEEEERFTLETAMLYDPGSERLLTESRVGGIGEGGTAEYFQRYAEKDTHYTLVPLLDEAASARARRHQTLRSVEMRMAMGPVTEEDREAGLGFIQAVGESLDCESVDITFKGGRARGRTLSIDSFWRMAERVLGAGQQSRRVSKLRVSGREHEDDPLERIDLIEQRLVRERLLPVDTNSRNIARDLRWQALMVMNGELV